jgi:hypothetical protein
MDIDLGNQPKNVFGKDFDGWDTKRTTSVYDNQNNYSIEDEIVKKERKRSILERELNIRKTLEILEGNTERTARQQTESRFFETKVNHFSTSPTRRIHTKEEINFPLRSFKVKWLLDQRPDILVNKSTKEIKYFERALQERHDHTSKPTSAFVASQRGELYEAEVKVRLISPHLTVRQLKMFLV